MRIVLAFLVLGWLVNLIFALATHDPASVIFSVLYLGACIYGLFARGILLGLIGWVSIGIGLEALFLLGSHTNVPALTLLLVLFWSGLAILAGNLFRSD
jgi:hypothetical protein